MNSIARIVVTFTMPLLILGCGGNKPQQPSPEPQRPVVRVHPVFHTPITRSSTHRPAIQLDIKDDGEFIGRAELYLTVQSSAFPAETWIVLPVNVGDFAGCRTRYVQLPFEVQSKDVLLFNVLDEDGLTDAEEKLVLKACHVGGYCIHFSGKIYAPQLEVIIDPVANVGAEILGDAIINDFRQNKFKNLGIAEYITPPQMPQFPNEANELTLLDSKTLKARVVLKIYGPDSPIEFAAAQR